MTSPGRTNRTLVAAGAAVMAVVLAAVGFVLLRDDEKPVVGAPAAAQRTRPPMAPASRVDPRAVGGALLVTAKDLPPGWTASSPASTDLTSGNTPAAVGLAGCTGAPDPNTALLAYLLGGGFKHSGKRATIISSVQVLRDQQAAQRALSALVGPQQLPCVKQLEEVSYGQLFGASSVRLELLKRPIARFGQATLHFRGKAVITPESSGRSITAYIDHLFLMRGAAGVQIIFFGLVEPNDLGLISRIAQRVGMALNKLTL